MLSVKFTDNSDEVLRMAAANKKRALYAMGTEAVGLVKNQMEHGYAKPVRDTGALMGSIAHIEEENATVVGTDKDYAPFIHDGHLTRNKSRFIPGRPLLKDGILLNMERLQQVAEQELKRGLE